MVMLRDGQLELRIDTAAGVIAAHGLRLELGHGQTPEAAQVIAGAVVAVAKVLRGAEWSRAYWGRALLTLGRLLRREQGIDRVLRSAGLTAVDTWPEHLPQHGPASRSPPQRPIDEAWWSKSGVRAVVSIGILRVEYEKEVWVTSHSTGTVGIACAELACNRLPAYERGARKVIDALITIAIHASQQMPVSHVCRFCNQSFGPMQFHVELQSCHGCAETHLHVVH